MEGTFSGMVEHIGDTLADLDGWNLLNNTFGEEEDDKISEGERIVFNTPGGDDYKIECWNEEELYILAGWGEYDVVSDDFDRNGYHRLKFASGTEDYTEPKATTTDQVRYWFQYDVDGSWTVAGRRIEDDPRNRGGWMTYTTILPLWDYPNADTDEYTEWIMGNNFESYDGYTDLCLEGNSGESIEFDPRDDGNEGAFNGTDTITRYAGYAIKLSQRGDEFALHDHWFDSNRYENSQTGKHPPIGTADHFLFEFSGEATSHGDIIEDENGNELYEIIQPYPEMQKIAVKMGDN